jgi:DNA primase
MAGIDFAWLRRQVSLAEVLELVGFRATTRRGAQVRGPCPVHGSSSPQSRSFAGHLQKNCWRCFGCGAGGNALDLYAAVTKRPLYEAALELCARLQVPVPWLARGVSRPRQPP